MSLCQEKIKTFVYFDIETTGLPEYEFNRTRITEFTLVAVQRDHLIDCKWKTLPRVLQKLTLCVNPRKIIVSTEITGLANDLLEMQKSFDVNTIQQIQLFLSRLPEPVCLIAHNGNKFDYPILQKEIQKLGQQLDEKILCADSLLAFRELHEKHLMPDQTETLLLSEIKPLDSDTKTVQHNYEEKLNIDEKPTEENSISSINEYTCSPLDSLFSDVSSENMKTLNETTPKKNLSKTDIEHQYKMKRKLGNGNCNSLNSRARKSLFSTKTSFKLTELYERIFDEKVQNAHYSENDVLILIQISIACGEHFFNWCDKNASSFYLIKPI